MKYATTSNIYALVDENIALIEQGVELISTIDGAVYRRNDHDLFTSGVGKHFRHVLDFYDRFTGGYRTIVDYDERRRDERIETDPQYAAERARSVCDALRRMAEATGDDESRGVRVRVEIRDRDGSPIETDSTLDRELDVLAAHTIHHYALIAQLLRIQGVEVVHSFGVAPSTLRFLAEQSK